MIKLPDFSKCIEIKELLRSMGVLTVKKLPDLRFTHKVRKTEIVKIDNSMQFHYAQKLKMESIPLSADDRISFDKNGLIEINGLKCCLYIKEQREQYFTNGKSGYRYHLCCCSKIEEMIGDWRGSRYVKTSRDDGFFPVIIQNSQTNSYREVIIPLDLCRYCMQMLQQRGMYFIPFTLKEFYKRFQPEIPEYFEREETRFVMEQYAPDHQEVAKKYKEKAHYTCDRCGVNCSDYPKLLHLHHKDGRGQNNRGYNLRVLCLECHAEQPLHEHMKDDCNYEENVALLHRLQAEQGIFSVRSDGS